MAVVAAILAAGGGTRFSGSTHKLLAEVRGKRVIDWAYEHARAADLDPIVIWGAVPLGLAGAAEVHNPVWADGIATSLHVAIEIADDAGADAVVVGLGDQPGVPPDAWRRVAACDATPIAVAAYGGVPGNPVRLARSVWALLPVTGDEGARTLMRERPSLVTAVACPGDPSDVDTVEDLDRWS